MPMSLSPRPERFTISMSDLAILGARLMHSATACALLKRGNDAFGSRQPVRRVERLAVAGRYVLGAARSCSAGMLGADGGVVESGGDGVRQRDLSVLVLQHVGVGSLQHPGAAAFEARRVLAERVAAAAGLDADQLHLRVLDELVERADGVRSAAHAGDDRGGQRPSFSRICLRASWLMTR